MTLSRVSGHGGEREIVEHYRGSALVLEFREKVKIEAAVSEPFVEPTIRAIVSAARTGEVGDGKIFVQELDRVIRIRTGEARRRRAHAGDRRRGAGARTSGASRGGRVMTPAISAGDTAWVLDQHRARDADGAGPRALLRWSGAAEECAQHVHDEPRARSARDGAVGARAATRSRSVRHVLDRRLAWWGLASVGAAPNAAYAATIPHLAFAIFQAMFAAITVALISGAVVERLRFSAYLLFALAWTTLVYDPLARWVWGDGGWLRSLGALDFAGGTVVHVSAGTAALVAALMLGRRHAIARGGLVPHNVPFTLLGAGLLWFGWFGFNAGSALSASAARGDGARDDARRGSGGAHVLVVARPRAQSAAPRPSERRPARSSDWWRSPRPLVS